MPNHHITLAASTWPASLAGGDTSMRSSNAPVMNMTPAPSSSPTGSELPANISRNCDMCAATAIAARKPTNIAAPPSVGLGLSCTCRASDDGCTTAPKRMASRRTTGVISRVVKSATAQMTA